MRVNFLKSNSIEIVGKNIQVEPTANGSVILTEKEPVQSQQMLTGLDGGRVETRGRKRKAKLGDVDHVAPTPSEALGINEGANE